MLLICLFSLFQLCSISEKKKKKLMSFHRNYFFYQFQSTNIGQAHVIGGGIGQRSISVVIEARSTLYFAYRAAIFGY